MCSLRRERRVQRFSSPRWAGFCFSTVYVFAFDNERLFGFLPADLNGSAAAALGAKTLALLPFHTEYFVPASSTDHGVHAAAICTSAPTARAWC